jgi:hypothetical protein
VKYKKHLKLAEHYDFIEDAEVQEGIYLSYSDSVNKFFLNVVTSEPTDSWGINWEIVQSCVMFDEAELDNLINELQELKKQK